MNQPPASPLPGREFEFTEDDFQRIRKLIYDHAGIALTDAKQDLVYSRISRRLRATGLSSFRDYLTLLDTRPAGEWEAFVNALTTNQTSFFREPHHFSLLAEHLAHIRQRRPIRLWCSAASTGEEAYTMAMTVVDLFGSLTPPVQILATDLDTGVLRQAQSGIYSRESVERLPADVLQRFFLKGTGEHQDQAQVRQELRDLVTFRQLNLLEPRYPAAGPFDAIFCRNVMIYFDKPTQYRVLQKFVPLMYQDALLFAGHSESFPHAADLFQLRGKTVYTIAEPSRHLAHPAGT